MTNNEAIINYLYEHLDVDLDRDYFNTHTYIREIHLFHINPDACSGLQIVEYVIDNDDIERIIEEIDDGADFYSAIDCCNCFLHDWNDFDFLEVYADMIDSVYQTEHPAATIKYIWSKMKEEA